MSINRSMDKQIVAYELSRHTATWVKLSYGKWKKPNTNKCTWYDSIYIKFPLMQKYLYSQKINYSLFMEAGVRRVWWSRKSWKEYKGKWNFWGDEYVHYFDHSDSVTSVYICQSLSDCTFLIHTVYCRTIITQ